MTGEDKIRTLAFTYQADDQHAELFAVVMGCVAENFRGATLHEVLDETVLGDRDDRGALEVLYELVTSDGRLTEEQREELEDFGRRLNDWWEAYE